MKPIRIGKISFTNILPIYHYFDQRGTQVELIPQVPTQLNRGMAKGEIDMGPISSFAYAETYPDYVLMPDLSISATGPVGSIFLFTRGEELADLHQARIALTNTSASSVALLRILLEKFAGAKPEYVTMDPCLDDMMNRADAALLIGDDALKGLWRNSGYRILDLGQEWYNRTGMSMTYAVWAVRREIAETRTAELEEIFVRFMKAKEKGQRDPRPVIREAMRQLGGDVPFWDRYYDGLSYDLREKEIAGLKAYYRYGAELGLLPPDVQICMLDLPAGLGMR
ncbi:menaquinone biosynthetic enzyme MqnA/MqnD family protein [Paenactinomyces guangxiensis]|uniref:Chorismate dehydratase n=1 Tax=Paenactinomyces guangxiensis TaxID=1490290 RepID=A0A7W2A8G8_9BACL|nr:menaquinone biosynthesis protein [Paenactinomyces guangxiensis]MBA4495601.1 menaquinone biosynthesis protein [Paenactinomyces guangxiensis]MBH8592589.1 menaquinone biosynthesis protein [Paenactinomyces guangxiensis]